MKSLALLLPSSFALLLAACATSEEARKVEPAGYLGDYKLLRSESKERAALVYTNPKADFPAYDSIIVEPVTVYRGPNSQFKNMSEVDTQRAADYLRTALQRELAKVYTVTSRPGPKTLRLRVALTELQKSQAFLDTVSTVHPGALAASTASKATTGKHAFTGQAAAEGEITDSRTGERLLAGVTARVGGKSLDKKILDEWADIEDAADRWAEELAAHLAGLKRKRA